MKTSPLESVEVKVHAYNSPTLILQQFCRKMKIPVDVMNVYHKDDDTVYIDFIDKRKCGCVSKRSLCSGCSGE